MSTIVPYPEIGDVAVYRGVSDNLAKAPLHATGACCEPWIRTDPDTMEDLGLEGARGIGLDPEDRLTVRTDPMESRWDLYQWPHDVAPFNWTWLHGNNTLQFRTDYVSLETSEVARGVDNRSASWKGVLWMARGVPTILGSSLFWGMTLEEGDTFERNIGTKIGAARPPNNGENLTIRMRVEARERVAGWDTYRIEVLDADDLPAETEHGRVGWSRLTFWVSTQVPFVVQREGIWETPGDGDASHTAFTLESYEPGTKEVRFARDGRYQWVPRLGEVVPWDGRRPPGTGEAFTDFTMDEAFEEWRRREPLVLAWTLAHPTHQMSEVTYQNRGESESWTFHLAAPFETPGVWGRITREEGGFSTFSEVTTDTYYLPPDRLERAVTIDSCMTVWEEVAGNGTVTVVEWSTGNEQRLPYCAAGINLEASLGFLSQMSMNGALIGIMELPFWPNV